MRLAAAFCVLSVSLSVIPEALHAATRSMSGSVTIQVPSRPIPSRQDIIPTANQGLRAVNVVGPTGVGAEVNLPAGNFQFDGWPNFLPGGEAAPITLMRTFVGIPTFAQFSYSALTPHSDATFRVGSGAGAGGDIDWCPPAAGAAGGNSNCLNFTTAGAGALPIRIGIKPQSANAFGGTFQMLRNTFNAASWILAQATGAAGTPALFSVQPRTSSFPWTPGAPNYQYLQNDIVPGPVYSGFLVTQMTPTDPVNTSMVSASPMFVEPAPPDTFADGRAWGFRMTTGRISGSDGAPDTTPTSNPTFFFFATTGKDTTAVATTVSGAGPTTVRNLVLVGGAIAISGTGGNLFFRVNQLEMQLPEPAAGLGLAAGALLLVGIAWVRRR